MKLCTHEHGHILVLAIVNSLDDTKALKKVIFDGIVVDLPTILTSQWGRKVIEWFVSPGNRAGFHPAMTALIEEGLQFSKKDKEQRRAELLAAVEEPLSKHIVENPWLWLRGGHVALTTAEVLRALHAEYQKKAFDALATVVCDISWKVPVKDIELDESEIEKTKKKPVEDEKPLRIKKKKVFAGNDDKKKEEKIVELIAGIEHAGLHIALKKLIKLGENDDSAPKFSASLVENLDERIVSDR